MYEVTVYGRDGCPRCFYVKTKASQLKNVHLTEIHDNEILKEMSVKYGTDELPMSVVDGEFYDFARMKTWTDDRKREE